MSIAIEPRPIGRTGVVVTALGVGTASLGDVFGAVAAESSSSVVDACASAGIGYLDTAPLYGNGLAEQRLGHALSRPGLPTFTISTKAGRTLDSAAPEGRRFDLSADAIRRGLDGSLSRLGRDRIDILYIHDPDDHLAEVYEVWPTLLALKEEGMVGAIGFGMNQWRPPLEFVSRLEVDVVMLAGRYTLLDTSADREFLPTCQERGVAVVLAGVFNSGILVDPVDGAWYDYRPASAAQLRRARSLKTMAAEYGVPLPVLALQFAFRHPAATSVVVGAGSGRTVQQNVASLEQVVPDELWARIRELDGVPAL